MPHHMRWCVPQAGMGLSSRASAAAPTLPATHSLGTSASHATSPGGGITQGAPRTLLLQPPAAIELDLLLFCDTVLSSPLTPLPSLPF